MMNEFGDFEGLQSTSIDEKLAKSRDGECEKTLPTWGLELSITWYVAVTLTIRLA